MMDRVGPFEARPRIAVAVSGGADSMALALLGDNWARRRKGSIAALTVDHGLRNGSAMEAEKTGRWLARRQIEHHILAWRGPKPGSGIQAAARTARYRLMSEWSRQNSVLHLLLAHHQEDQAETFLIRMGRGSGVYGMSGMSAVMETPSVRLVRPLLEISRQRLKHTLKQFGQDWMEDPSNRDPAFARARLRSCRRELDGAGIVPSRLAQNARHMARVRVVLESAAVDLLAGCCSIYPAGYAEIDAAALMAGPAEISRRALARVLMCVGGGAYPPRLERLDRLLGSIAAGRLFRARTLAGCRVMPMRAGSPEAANLLICREGRGMARPMAIEAGAAEAGVRVFWDNRFVIRFAVTGEKAPGRAWLAGLGAQGWSEIAGQCPEIKKHPVPPAVRPSLPAISDDRGIFSVPHLNYRRPGGHSLGLDFARVDFSPQNTLSGTGFFLV